MKKLVLLVISVVCISVVCTGQTLKQLEDSINLYNYKNPEKTIEFLEKAIPLARNEENWERYIPKLTTVIANCYLIEDYETIEKYIELGFKAIKSYNLPPNSQPEYYLFNAKGNLSTEKSDTKKALYYLKKSLEIEKDRQLPVSTNIALNLISIGAAYSKLADFEQAIYHYKQAIQYVKQEDQYHYTHDYVVLYTNLGSEYYNIKDYQKATEYFEKAEKYISLVDMDLAEARYALTSFYINYAVNARELEDYEKTFFYLQKLLEHPNLNEKDRARYHATKGKTFTKQKKYQLAEHNLKEALNIRKSQYNPKHSEFTNSYQSLGDLYKAQKKYKKALENYQKGIQSAIYDFEEDDVNINPTLDKVVNQRKLLGVLYGKAHTLKLQQNYKQALVSYQLCIELLNRTRTSFQYSASKLFLRDNKSNIYEEAIEVALAIGDEKAAFTIAEQSKALLLLEAVRGQEARFGLPEEIVDKESDLKIDISYYQQKIWREGQKDKVNHDKINQWKDLIFDLKEQYSGLKIQLKEDYPDYYQQHYNSAVVNVKDIQRQLLDNKSAMVSYFIGEKQVYIFTITKKNIEVVTIEKDNNLTDWVNNMRLCLQRDNRIKNYHATYYETAFQLYQIFLQPALNNISKNIKQLIIIPDDQLNFIPFEALLTERLNLKTPRYELNKVPYLLRKYQVTYGYSGTLLLESRNKKAQKNLKTFGGFVPYFKGGTSERRGCDNDVLGNLAIGRENIQTINGIMNGKLHFDEEADVDDFKTLANQYKILHLCTHACAEEDFNDTRIYFSDKELLAFELYNMPLNAQLAVLSACETGIGELKRGEGVMSLARAFMYSGCPSVVTSLWSVDDKSTSDIMRYFYENLKSGMNKDAALHQAKLAYLDGKGIEESHPYYWSGFVHLGKTEALFANGDSNWIWWVGGGLMILGLGFGALKRKRK